MALESNHGYTLTLVMKILIKGSYIEPDPSYRSICRSLSKLRYPLKIETDSLLVINSILMTYTISHLIYSPCSQSSYVYFLPHTITHLTLGRDFHRDDENIRNKDYEGSRIYFPKNLMELTIFWYNFYIEISIDDKSKSSLPSTLTHLNLGKTFNREITILPNLSHLILSHNFNKGLDHLPLTLKSLTISFYFDLNLDLRYLSNLTNLDMSSNRVFNRTLDYLPDSLMYLATSSAFNQRIDLLPPNLSHLILGYSFNQRVDHLPVNLLHLTFGAKFNKPIERLPPNLKTLTFDQIRNCDFSQAIFNNLPKSLIKLTMPSTYNYLFTASPNLKKLVLGHFFNRPINVVLNGIIMFPMGLTHLTFGSFFNKKIDFIPPYLLHLHLELGSFNRKVDHLPIGLLTLKLGHFFNQKINHLPLSLKSLEIGNLFNQRVDRLPHGLERLILGYGFNRRVDKLPTSLIYLSLPKVRKVNKNTRRVWKYESVVYETK